MHVINMHVDKCRHLGDGQVQFQATLPVCDLCALVVSRTRYHRLRNQNENLLRSCSLKLGANYLKAQGALFPVIKQLPYEAH